MRYFVIAAIALFSCGSAKAQLACQSIQVGTLEASVAATPPIGEVTGVARNVGTAPLRYVSLTFNLLDANNTVVGNTIANGLNIGPGQTWRFSAVTTVNYQTVRLTGSSCM